VDVDHLHPDPHYTNQSTQALSNISELLQLMKHEADKSKLRDSEGSDDERADSSCKAWTNIPKLLRDMVIRASSINDTTFPSGPCDSLLEILRPKKVVMMKTLLNTLLQNMNCQVNVSVALVTAIANANLRPSSCQAPHPFSCLHTPYYDASSSNAETDIKLQLMASDGLGVDKATAESLAKDSFSIPTNTHKLRHQLNNFWGLLVLIFGQESLIAAELAAWVKHIDTYESTYDEQFKIDSNAGAKICSLIDRSIHQVLGSCLVSKEPEDIEWDLLCQAAKRADIRQNCFQANLPAYLVKSKKITEDSDDDEPVPKKHKKGGKPQSEKHKALGEMIINSKRNMEWDCKGKYHKIFKGKVISETPPFNNTGLITCNKWHVQGRCFKECARKDSHKPFADENCKKDYDAWVKDLKAKNP
jgi:hypothetical protein